MYKSIKKHKKSASKPLLVILSVFLLVIIGTAIIYVSRNNHASKKDEINTSTSVDAIEQVNHNPPTPQEIKETRDHKDSLGNMQNNDTGSQKKQVTPTIVSAGVYEGTFEVSAYVDGIVEDGGTCTAILTKDSIKKEVSVRSEKDVSKTLCPTIVFSNGEISAGSWSVRVTYDSSIATGSSSVQVVKVQPQ